MGVETAIIGAIAAVSAGTSMHQQKRAEKRQASAQRKAQAQADANLKQQEEDQNRLNRKRADPYGALNAANNAGRGGVSGTLLTGAQGIDPSDMKLGKNNLLGM